MANKYYYLISSLPYIAFGKAAPLTKEHFISECRKWLGGDDLKGLLGIDAKNPEAGAGDRGFTREWKEFDARLRKTLAESRASRRLHHEERIHGAAKDILDQSTPLDIEKRFERIRWDFLDEKEADFYFDLSWLMVYYLKLQISGRLAMFRQEEGARAFEAACEVAHG